MQITVNNINCKVTSSSPGELSKLRNTFKVFAPGYRFNYLYKMRKWDGKVSLVSTDGEFPTGLLPEVISKFTSINLVDERVIKQITCLPCDMDLRDYQRLAIQKCFTNTVANSWWPRGIIQVATGGGKTEIATAMIKMAKVKTLFLIDSRQLVNQTIERFKKYGISASEDLESQVTVTTVQSLMSWAHKTNKTKNRSEEEVQDIKDRKNENAKVVIESLKLVEQVFVDEAHCIASSSVDKGNMFVQALELMPNAYMRWGLTASPFMREEYHNLLLQGTAGDVLYRISGKDLIEAGYLAKPNITMFKCSKLEIPNKWPLAYELGVVLNDERNTKIVSESVRLDGPIMILVKAIGHGALLEKMLNAAGVPTRFLFGECTTMERERALQDLKSGTLKAVIGSKIWDKGLDVAEIKALIIAAGGKSKVANLQRLGRGLRLSEGKTSVEVIDFLDNTTKWLKEHSKSRKLTFIQEGYTVIEQDI